MKKIFLLFPLCISFITSVLFAETKKVMIDATPFLGYRQTNIKWSTKNGANFKWKNLRLLELGINGNTALKDKYIIKHDLGLSTLLSGRFQDTSYLVPAGPHSSASVKGWGLGFHPNFALGYKFKPNKKINFVPQIGYSYELLYVNINKDTGPLSSFKDTMHWHGPWVGLEATAKLFQRLTVNMGLAYQVGFYRANGNWKTLNIATKNKLTQSGTGTSIFGRIKVAYEVAKSINIGAEGDIERRRTLSGNDKRSFADGTSTKSKLKKVNWVSFGGRLTLTKTF